MRLAIAEMTSEYGTKVEKVGSFNGLVHIDANVDGVRPAQRIVRYPKLAARSTICAEEPTAADRLDELSNVIDVTGTDCLPGVGFCPSE